MPTYRVTIEATVRARDCVLVEADSEGAARYEAERRAYKNATMDWPDVYHVADVDVTWAELAERED